MLHFKVMKNEDKLMFDTLIQTTPVSLSRICRHKASLLRLCHEVGFS